MPVSRLHLLNSCLGGLLELRLKSIAVVRYPLELVFESHADLAHLALDYAQLLVFTLDRAIHALDGVDNVADAVDVFTPEGLADRDLGCLPAACMRAALHQPLLEVASFRFPLLA